MAELRKNLMNNNNAFKYMYNNNCLLLNVDLSKNASILSLTKLNGKPLWARNIMLRPIPVPKKFWITCVNYIFTGLSKYNNNGNVFYIKNLKTKKKLNSDGRLPEAIETEPIVRKK